MRLLTPRTFGVVVMIGSAAAFFQFIGRSIIDWDPSPKANFWVLVATAVAATWYGWLTHLIRRAEHTPVLTASYNNNQTVITNNGKGAALNATLTDNKGNVRLTIGDVPPGDTHGFGHNVGWNITDSFYVFYQNVFGHWYATKSLASIIAHTSTFPITNNFQGRIFNPPPDAARQASTQSAFEYMLRMAHWWSPRFWFQYAKQWSRKRWIAFRTMWIVRRASRLRVLSMPFTPEELAHVIDWPTPVVQRFIEEHSVSNTYGGKEYFKPSRTAGYYFINMKVFL
jgi:hypothetical protein